MNIHYRILAVTMIDFQTDLSGAASQSDKLALFLFFTSLFATTLVANPIRRLDLGVLVICIGDFHAIWIHEAFASTRG